MAVIGIDLGTTNSLAAVWQQDRSRLIPNALGDVLTPSAVSIDEDGTVLVGEAARQRLVSHPERSAAAFKRAMGTDRTYSLAGRTFTPEELSALVLRQLKQDAEAFLGEPVEEAVISVPAYFNDRQRAATKRAGQLAGLLVERLVNEPSAAALSSRVLAKRALMLSLSPAETILPALTLPPGMSALSMNSRSLPMRMVRTALLRLVLSVRMFA